MEKDKATLESEKMVLIARLKKEKLAVRKTEYEIGKLNKKMKELREVKFKLRKAAKESIRTGTDAGHSSVSVE